MIRFTLQMANRMEWVMGFDFHDDRRCSLLVSDWVCCGKSPAAYALYTTPGQVQPTALMLVCEEHATQGHYDPGDP